MPPANPCGKRAEMIGNRTPVALLRRVLVLSYTDNIPQGDTRQKPEDQFDPSRFHLPDVMADPLVDEIPAEKVVQPRPLEKELFAIVPLRFAKHMPPAGRLIVLLCFLNRAAKPDGEGWHKLTAARLDKVGITDRHQAYRAVAALEKEGLISSLRRAGRTMRIKLSGLQAEAATLLPERRPAAEGADG